MASTNTGTPGLGMKLKYKIGQAADVVLDSVLVSITPPARTARAVPKNLHQDAWDTYLFTKKNPGQLVFTLLKSTIADTLDGLVGTEMVWTITFSDAETVAATGGVISSQESTDAEGAALHTFTIQLSGAVT